MVSLTATNPRAAAAVATRIVGIGASAGGLAPLEEFLGNIPPHTGLAYVVVQHLDPTHKALLSELLQRVTPMPVREARQTMRVEPDCVYVIPPNTELSIVNGALHLASPVEPRGMRLPINVLFSSLAATQGERAIAVVLSGMGSDGTLGLQAVKAVGGLTVVQQSDTAQFDAMPKSAIAAGCSDIIAPPAELPARILAYVNQVPDPGNTATADPESEPEPLQRILDLLQRRTRHDFSRYKPSTLHRRVERRMAIHDLTTLADYAVFLQENANEIDLLFKELLIGVTSFFRDAAVWESLASSALPELLERRSMERKLRVWVVGCSTGEEAYSLAMIFSEVIRQRPDYAGYTLQIFASDLSPEAIDTARRGRYPAAISESVSAERLEQFFTAREGGYAIKPEIRDMVLFAQQNVILDPPFTKLDLIACRNLLIYFDATLQRRLIPLFHYSLREGGVLLLGSAETVGRFGNLFRPIQSSLRLYQRQDDVPGGGAEFMMKSFPPLSKIARESHVSTADHTPSDNLQAAADQVMLQLYAPASVVINGNGDILYISGRTGKYLEPAAGKANWNIHAMVREGLRVPISTALKKSTIDSEPQHLHGLHVQLPGGGEQRVDVTIQVLREPAALRGATMIVFRDIEQVQSGGRKRKGRGKADASHESELQKYRDEIQSLREEARASREELQSANEELQSTNEELQSTNEELTTSKEEMQSMNEELQTINSELQTKLDDLALAQSDMSNLLNSIEIAILFLDQNMNVRRYTDRATKIVNIRESDVGRPFSDLTSNLQYPQLHDDAIETLRTLTFSEKQILTNEGRWFSVRIIPYRRMDNVIDGVVITFVDITETKNLEQALRHDLDV
jgi:two-component system, chemotaxis family, CheB/CheR fusion protein